MQDDDDYLYHLNDVLREGFLSEPEPEQERYALEEYTTLVSGWLGEDLRAMSEARDQQLSREPEYPYWFCSLLNTCDGDERSYRIVEVKEPWYLLYLQQQEQWEQMTPEEQQQRDPLQSFRELETYMTRIANIRQQAPKN